jgi:hypothetical protein
VSQQARFLGLASREVVPVRESPPGPSARACRRMGVLRDRNVGYSFPGRWRPSRCRRSRSGRPAIPLIAPTPSVRLVALAAAALVICGCAPAARPHPVHASRLAPSVPCAQQYARWRNGPVNLAARRLAAQARAVRLAVRSEDAAAIRTAMRPLERTSIALAAAGAMPRCADTDGIYAQLVLGIYQAGAKARTATSISGLARAASLLSRTLKIEHRLSAETSGTVHKDSCRPGTHGSTPRSAWPPC